MPEKIRIKQSSWAVIRRKAKDGTILYLVGKRSDKVRNPGKWGFFGGSIAASESPEKALKRELIEESGLQATKISKLTTVSQPDRVLHYFEVNVKNVKVKLNKETSRAKWLSDKELRIKQLHLPVKVFLNKLDKSKLTFRLNVIASSLQQQVVAYVNDEIVGGATITLANGALHNFHVNEKFRGNGYAHQIMSYLLSLPTPPRKLTAAPSMGSPINGHDLIKFYSKYGFVIKAGDHHMARMERAT